MMTPLPLLLFLFLSASCLASSPPATVSTVAALPGSNPDTVEEACLLAWKGKPQYDPCLKALRSAPGVVNATLPELATLSISLSSRDSSAVLGSLQKLKPGGGGGAPSQESLAACIYVYRRSIDAMKDSADFVQQGKYGAAGYHLASAMESTECADAVGGQSVVQPRAEIVVLVGVAKAVCYEYCMKTSKQVPPKECFFL